MIASPTRFASRAAAHPFPARPHRRRAAIATAALLLAACTDAPPDVVVEPPTPVETAVVTADTVAAPVLAIGRWTPRDEATLTFKTGGIVAQVLVDEGATVRRGQPLARLDLREIDALVAKAEAAFEKADRDAVRLRALFADSVVTLAQLQDAETGRRAAQADLDAARVNREYSVITAPADGLVLERQLDAGALAAPGTPVFRFGDARRGRVFRGGVADRDAVRLAVGDRASVAFDALPDRTFDGRIVLVGKSADARTGTYTVEIVLDGDTDRLPVGLVGRATLRPAGGTPAARLPVEALLEADGDSASVYVLDATASDDAVDADANADATAVARRRRVQVVALEDQAAAVRGLDAGSTVVTSGASFLRDGRPVRVVRRDTLLARLARADRTNRDARTDRVEVAP